MIETRMTGKVLTVCAFGLFAGCGIVGRSAELRITPVGLDAVATATPDRQFEVAKYHLSRNNEALAIEILRRIKRDRPNDVRVLNALGVAYDRMGRFDTSRGYYEAALGADPTADYVTHNLAYSLDLQGHHTEAQALYARVDNSNDAEVRGRAIELAATGLLATPASDYSPVRYAAAGHVARTTAKVQTLSWSVVRPIAATTISFDNSVALLSVADDRAFVDGVSRAGGRKEEWEVLVAAALASPGGSQVSAKPMKALTSSLPAAFNSGVLASLQYPVRHDFHKL